jgi:hypothetical protein
LGKIQRSGLSHLEGVNSFHEPVCARVCRLLGQAVNAPVWLTGPG